MPPSTYYAAKKREREATVRSIRDEWLKKEVRRVWADKKIGRRVYGARKVWRQLRREGIEVARRTVERLIGELGIAGAAARRKKPRTTVPAPAGQPRPSDLLERDFTAAAPARRWVADITYVDTASGFAYTAFVTDLFSRRIVGWQVRIHCGLSLPSMRWRWRYGHLGIRSVISSFIILTGVSSIRRSATRSGWVISARSAPWEVRVIPMITRLWNR
jgi:putative transposase